MKETFVPAQIETIEISAADIIETSETTENGDSSIELPRIPLL